MSEDHASDALALRLAAARGRLTRESTTIALHTDEDAPFAPSAMQQAYWIGREEGLALGGTACFVYYELDGFALDPDRFDRAWAALIARHNMLRVDRTDDGQLVIRRDPLDPPRRHIFESPAEAAAGRASIRDEMVAFLAGNRQWPFHALRLSVHDNRTTIHIGLDMVIGDGHSLRLLLDDLAAFYATPADPPPPLALTYRDYLDARRIDAAAVERARLYWAERVATLPPPPRLPLAAGSAAFARQRVRIDPADWTTLRAQAQAAGVSGSTLLLTAFADVLAIWSETPRFTLNLTLFDRERLHPDVDGIVGDFSSNLLLSFEQRLDHPFAERLQSIHARLLAGLDHRAYAGILVARDLARQKGERAAALMPVVFTSHLGEGCMDGPWPILDGITQTPQVWLDHQAYEESDGALILHWDAPADRFAPGVIEAIAESTRAWLARLARGAPSWTDPAAPPFPAVSPVQAPAAAPRPLLAWPADDGIAVVDGSLMLTAGEVRRLAHGLAATLIARGIGHEAIVAIAVRRGWGAVVAQCGSLLAGGAFLPIDVDLPRARIETMLEDAGAAAIVTDVDAPDWLRAHAGAIDVAIIRPAGVLPDMPDPQPDALAYIIYTSGSTGQPKAVLIEHSAAANTIDDINRRFAVGPSDAILWVSAPSFDLSIYDVFGSLAIGARLVCPGAQEDRDPAAWVAAIARHGVTVWNSAPALMDMLITHLETSADVPPDTVRLVLLSGDWIPVSLPDRIRRQLGENVRIVSLGGATEVSIWSVIHEIGVLDPGTASIPYGYALGGQFLDIRSRTNAAVPDWVAGELVIGGAGVARGYHRRPALTAECFVPCPITGGRIYRTGDLARRRPDQTFELLGRIDRQMKLLGHRIEPGEIEAALLAIDDIAAAAVVVRAGRLVAYCIPGGRAPIDPAAIRRACAARLPAHMVPVEIMELARLPLTANGKLDRHALPAPVLAAATRIAATTADPIERRLSALWESVLGQPPRSRDEDFYAAGGHSVLAVRLHGLIVAEYGRALPLRELFAGASIANLAATLAQTPRTAVTAAPIVPAPADRHEIFPLTDVQQAYWVGREDGFELGNVAPHAYAEFEAERLDIDRFSAAVSRLIDRHDMLRAIVEPNGGQRVLADPGPYAIPVTDLRALGPVDRNAVLAATRERLSSRIADPSRWPLFGIELSLLPDRVRIHLEIDLLIADAWSVAVLRDELTLLYRDPAADMPEIGVQFRDAVLRERSVARDAERLGAKAYWTARLHRLAPPPDLPLAQGPSAIAAPRFERRSATLAPETWRAFGAACARLRVTTSAALATVFAEILGRHARQKRLTLNLSLFERPTGHPDIDRVVGDFTSLLLVEVDSDPALPFAHRVAATQRRLAEALENRAWSGVEVLRARAVAGLAAMPVVFTSMIGLRRADPAGEPWSPIFGLSQTPQVWLDHQLFDQADGGVRYHWDSVAGLFPSGYVDDLFAAYAEQLASRAATADSWSDVSARPPGPGIDDGIGLAIDDRDRIAALHRARRSIRQFDAGTVPLDRLSRLLTALMAIDTGDAALKRRYGSAGTLYPVRAYLIVREGRVEQLDSAIYLYDPIGHRLQPVPLAEPPSIAQLPDAAFAIVLVAALGRIIPVYGDKALDFCRIEAGLMAQALETEACEAGVGLCQYGGFPFGLIADALAADERPLHALAGGLPGDEIGQGFTAITPAIENGPRCPAAMPPESLLQQIAEIWAEVLDRADPPLDRRFAELGGNSVLLVRLRNRLAEALGRPIPLRDLLRQGTIADQARWLSAAPADPALGAARSRGARRRAARQPQR